MKQHDVVAQQFGATANAYLSSSVHASGADLVALQTIAARYSNPEILDLGCGAGHVSFTVAPHAKLVIACDVTAQMLEVVAQVAGDRNLANIQTQLGSAENLPFADARFDLVVTRFSAHHWQNVPAALREVGRVLRPGGVFVVIDIIAPETALFDTTLQAVELLRDASHVRDYRRSEWSAMLSDAAFEFECRSQWKLVMQFNEWIARMQTPPERVQAIRSLFDSAPQEASAYFQVRDDYSFSIDAALFEATKQS
jgi:ubiquinone/menaquinone biosynthesis C-methylase UbiE